MCACSDLLVYHIDDLEDIIGIMKQKGRVDKREFQDLVKTVRCKGYTPGGCAQLDVL